VLCVFTSLSKLCKNAGPIGGRLLIATHLEDQSHYVANEQQGMVLSFAVPFNRLKQATVQKCWAKTNILLMEPNRHVLTFVHANLICRVTY
jgi:hypothetical protein